MALRFVFQAQGRGGSLFLRSVLGEVSTLGAAPSQTQPLSRMNQRNFTSLLQSQTPQPMPTSRLAPRTSFFHSSSLLSMDIEEAEVEEVDFLDESEAVVIQQYGVTPQTFVHKKENLMTFEELYSNLKDFLTNEDYLHFKVKKVAVYHLFNKAQSKEDFQKAVEILRETQVRLLEYPDSTIKVIINAALRTGALDEGVGLFHRSRTMAQFFNGDSFIFRLFPPPTQFNFFMTELIKRGRDDLVPVLVKTFRARFSPHRGDKDVSASHRREFYSIVLKWLRTLGENEEANHIVKEIEEAGGLEIGASTSLVEAVCGHYLTGGFHESSLAAQKAREWGNPQLGDCFEVLASAKEGNQEASSLYQKTVSSPEAGRTFFRVMSQNAEGVGNEQLVAVLGEWENAVNAADEHAKKCAERCLEYLQENKGDAGEEAGEEAGEDAEGDGENAEE